MVDRTCFSRAVLSALLLAAAWVVAMPLSHAQSSECVVDRYNNTVCPPAKTLCIAEPDSGIVRCSPADGGLVVDRYNKVQCGVGRCVMDIRGNPFCSKAVGGAAARGQYGDAVCTEGCVPAQASMCSQLTR